MRYFKSQIEQLDAYFRANDYGNASQLDSQSIPFRLGVEIFKHCNNKNSKTQLPFLFCDCIEVVETIRVVHKNLLNEAAKLKVAHEQVEVIRSPFHQMNNLLLDGGLTWQHESICVCVVVVYF